MSPSAWSRSLMTDLFLKAVFRAIPDLDWRVKSSKTSKPEVSNTYWLLHRKNHPNLTRNFWALFSTFLTVKIRSFLQCFFVNIKKYRFFTLFYHRDDAIGRAFLKKPPFLPIFENSSLRRPCQNETTPFRIFLHFWRSSVFRHWCIAIWNRPSKLPFYRFLPVFVILRQNNQPQRHRHFSAFWSKIDQQNMWFRKHPQKIGENKWTQIARALCGKFRPYTSKIRKWPCALCSFSSVGFGEQMRWKGPPARPKIAINRPKPANQNIVCNSQFSAL